MITFLVMYARPEIFMLIVETKAFVLPSCHTNGRDASGCSMSSVRLSPILGTVPYSGNPPGRHVDFYLLAISSLSTIYSLEIIDTVVFR